MGGLRKRPRIYADGDRVFIDLGYGVFEASILVTSNIQIGREREMCHSWGGESFSCPGQSGGAITLEFRDFKIHDNKSLDDIPKDMAGRLSVMELFDVINGKLTEREADE